MDAQPVGATHQVRTIRPSSAYERSERTADPAAHSAVDGKGLIEPLKTVLKEELDPRAPGWAERILNKALTLADLTSSSIGANLIGVRNTLRGIVSEHREHQELNSSAASFLKRTAAWLGNFVSGGETAPSRICSPLDNLLAGMGQLEKLQTAVRSRGEPLTPSISDLGTVFQHRCFHPLIQEVAVTHILNETADTQLAGAIPALFAVIRSDGPSTFTYGTELRNTHEKNLHERVSDGITGLESYFQSQSYRTISEIVKTSKLQLGAQCAQVLSIRQLGDTAPSRDGHASEFSGKNLALCLEVVYPDRERGSIILKKHSEGAIFDPFATKFCKAIGLQSYGAKEVSGGWLAIEKLDAALLAHTDPRSALHKNEETISRVRELSTDQKRTFLQELGKIFAIEHALAVRDCKAKHILFDRTSERPFRIDWEYIFAFDQPNNNRIPAYPGPCEMQLVEALTSGPDKDTLTKAINQGFDLGCSEIKAAIDDPNSTIRQLLEREYPDDAMLYRERILARIAEPPPPLV